MARRPPQIPVRAPLTAKQIQAASYVGSAEHKAQRWWGGLPAARADEGGAASRPKKQTTTICPLVTEEERREASEWVRAALAARQSRYYEADKIFPKKVWYKDESARFWFGYCVNSLQGHYKGWPSSRDEIVEVFGGMAE